MAEQDTATGDNPQVELEGGTYEIIRNRLNNFSRDLRERLEVLNQERKEVFGSIDTVLLGTERINTEHNCVARDLMAIGSQFVFGYNVHFGLKSETDLSDVFGVFEFRDNTFHQQSLELLADEKFERDFKEIYRYYKNAVFAKFFLKGAHLYMVFRISEDPTNIKSLKWLVQDNKLVYLDNRSDHEVRFPPQHEFEWSRTHRDLHRSGQHPHISIDDRLFVECVGGDLTIKIENNTDSGEGIYEEDVEHRDQTLDDAEIHYAIVGNLILLKIRPYQENDFRYLVYNEKTAQVRRIDSIAHACVLLPDDHGLIFSNGYYLQNGEHKTFDVGLTDMMFDRRIASPNGEDYLYVFYNRRSGVYVLLQYNVIEQRVDTPMIVNGGTLFDSGELVCFKSQADPQKHHAVQLWRTPYVAESFTQTEHTDSFLYKIGNRDIVRGMAECHEVLALIEKEDTYANLYVDLVKKTGDIIDSYFWVSDEEAGNLKASLADIREAAESAVEEYEKVIRVKKNTATETKRVKASAQEILAALLRKRFDHINEFVTSLADLRAVRGDVISLKELRYVDDGLVDSLEAEVAENSEKLAQRCVQFLLREDSLDPYKKSIVERRDSIDGLTKVSDAKRLEEEISDGANELEMLIDIVSNLKIDDATQRTAIIDSISAIFSNINQARAALKTKIRDLSSVEGVAEFNSQIKLLNQSVVNYLDLCDGPEKCEEFLTKLMIQLEELEGRFAEFDEFVVQLTEKREEVYNAFETRKLTLVEARNKRANSLMSAADRILKGIKSRIDSLESVNDINAYFASDLMIEKVRDLVGQLQELDDSVKVDDIQSRLKSVREEAVRQLKDRQELFVDGENIIKFGKHRFNVNVQALDLTMVMRDGEMCLHLTGTNFFEQIEHPELLACRDVWDQEVVSENRDVYRGEYLAYQLFNDVVAGKAELSLEELLKLEEADRLNFVQRFMGPRYSEAYVKGVSDHDASSLIKSLLEMQSSIGLLRFHARARAMAAAYWRWFGDKRRKELMTAKLQGVGSILQLFPETSDQQHYIDELASMLGDFCAATRLFNEEYIPEGSEYLFHELSHAHGDSFAVSRTAATLYDAFQGHLRSSSFADSFSSSVDAVRSDGAACYSLVRDWSNAYVSQREEPKDEVDFVDELAVLLMNGPLDHGRIIDGDVVQQLTGIIGSHPVVKDGGYRLHFNHFVSKLSSYEHETAPRFRRCVELKKEIVDENREEMRLEEFRPRVLTSFVRNKLIDTVYLPIVGDNLAKQMGVAGEQKRTDLMGLLLLISPPGYGKTTLMEYIANRLGLIFMKINGPAIGHQVTSLDPEEAPNAGAREEVEKLNLSLEMGDNVMIYLDDIQHCNPEFLQKFISLCDAQRKIEGVYRGRTRTYDLRGRKVAVVMAGNPYTESGEKFQIPDMLSNRADIYNLGEIIGDSADAFELSYLENALTSNPILNKLASRSQQDVYSVIQMAQRDSREGIELEGNFSLEDVNEFVIVIKKLFRVRDVVLQVNREYIRSAAQADEYRTEPPFKLQGSYRNMNRIAEKVVPIMNDEELQTLLLSNYENDAQTLTSDTESNLLKFREIMGILSEEEARRWEDICRAFKQNVKMKGIGEDDQFGQVLVQLSSFGDGLESIRRAMHEGVERLTQEDEPSRADRAIEAVAGLQGGLQAIQEALQNDLTSGAVEKLADELKSLQPTAAEAPAEAASGGKKVHDEASDESSELHRITVQHKVPRSILNVVRSQFEMMQSWMEPLLAASRDQSTDLQKLRQSVDTCLANYATLLAELESAKPTRSK